MNKSTFLFLAIVMQCSHFNISTMQRLPLTKITHDDAEGERPVTHRSMTPSPATSQQWALAGMTGRGLFIADFGDQVYQHGLTVTNSDAALQFTQQQILGKPSAGSTAVVAVTSARKKSKQSAPNIADMVQRGMQGQGHFLAWIPRENGHSEFAYNGYLGSISRVLSPQQTYALVTCLRTMVERPRTTGLLLATPDHIRRDRSPLEDNA